MVLLSNLKYFIRPFFYQTCVQTSVSKWSPYIRCLLGINAGQKPKRNHSSLAKEGESYDMVIIGAGIVGLATARELIMRHPHLSFAVLEKEDHFACHQSGHNSGVLHAGIYYTPGSLKARLCVRGIQMTYDYCDQNDVPYKKCGKLIVATSPAEVDRLNTLYERGQMNNVKDLRMLESNQIADIEPNCVGVKAIHSPHTGIIDFAEVTRSYSRNFEHHGGSIHTGFKVTGFHVKEESPAGSTSGLTHPVIVQSEDGQVVQCRYVLTCGGLHADRLARISGCNPEPKIVPFRGDYLLLSPEKCSLINGNIYPVPDPRFPFLGFHLTPRIDGSVWLGPSAVLAFKREGYRFFDFSMKDFSEAVSFRGLRRLAGKHLLYGMKEIYRGINIAAQVKLLQRFVPSLQVSDVTRGPSGVRAQALDRDGNLVDDFIFDGGQGELGSRILHVRNAPSPAATSSLAIAEIVADEVQQRFQL